MQTNRNILQRKKKVNRLKKNTTKYNNKQTNNQTNKERKKINK